MIVRRCFTLIEIMVVLAILALTGGIAALKMRDFLKQQTYLDDSALLLNELRLTQDLMLIMEIDSEVNIKKMDDHFTVQIEAKSPPPELGKKIIDHSTLKLKGIKSIEFEDSFSGTVLTDEIKLTFFSRGFTMNHGTLKLFPKTSSESVLAIELPGHPAPLELHSLDQFQESRAATKFEFIEKLTNLTFLETKTNEANEKSKDSKKTSSNAT